MEIWSFISKEKIIGPLVGSIIGGIVTFSVLYINILKDRKKEKKSKEENYLKSYTKIKFYKEKIDAPLQHVISNIHSKGIFEVEDALFDKLVEIMQRCRQEIDNINLDYIPLEIVESLVKLQYLLLDIETKIKKRDKFLHYSRASNEIEKYFKEIKNFTDEVNQNKSIINKLYRKKSRATRHLKNTNFDTIK